MNTKELYPFDYLIVKSPRGELFKLYNVEDLPEGYVICEGREFYNEKGYLREKYWQFPTLVGGTW